jgi:hypothetical protein
MVHSFRPDARLMSRAGIGLVLLGLLVLPAILPGQARAQQAFTPTATIKIPFLSRPQATLVAPLIIITESVPTFVVTDVGVSNLRSVQLTEQTTRTTAAIAFEEQFTATVNVQSPSSMLLGESRVITLEIIPEYLAQAAMVRAELQALKFDSADDGYPEKTVIVNTPVRWNWNIAPKEAGEQEFFLALSYVNSQGSRVHWQNITLNMSVSIAASPTGGATATFIDTPTLISFEISLTPSDTPIPTWTPTPTNTLETASIFTLTPTRTFAEKVSDDVSENPGTYLATVVTLVLGLLGVYFQYIRKSDKKTGSQKKQD